MSDAADVWVELGARTVRAGTLWTTRRRRVESATFRYDAAYLGDPEAYALDPALPLVPGALATLEGRSMFGAFSDCAPDRWGRRLVDRDEEARVREAGTGAERSFGEAEYLLRVRDDLRQGALRFRAGDGTWLATPSEGVPDLVELPALLSASESLERDTATPAELRVLLRGGSSLGGARPKAHVQLADGRIAIAKFPSPGTDGWDVMRWEAVALELARGAGVRASRAQLHDVGHRAVLLVRRFDREGDRRLGYISAMTLLERADGDHGSYVEIAEQIEEHSPSPTRDLHELWRRIVFGVLIRNTDDHLRNHGFLRRDSAGWSLAPAFDVNPDPAPGPALLSTSIDGASEEARIDLALAVADLFRLRPDGARSVVREVAHAVGRWRSVAVAHGVAASEIGRMARAFEHEQAERARAL